jgi:hypothetical protein
MTRLQAAERSALRRDKPPLRQAKKARNFPLPPSRPIPEIVLLFSIVSNVVQLLRLGEAAVPQTLGHLRTADITQPSAFSLALVPQGFTI